MYIEEKVMHVAASFNFKVKYSIFRGKNLLEQQLFSKNAKNEGSLQKNDMEFSILSKTHPPHSSSMKKNKITWSKNHF